MPDQNVNETTTNDQDGGVEKGPPWVRALRQIFLQISREWKGGPKETSKYPIEWIPWPQENVQGIFDDLQV